MKKVLFVDDEMMVLNGLKRMLHRYKDEWKMFFAEGARLALGILEHEEIDVVVTDMRMPEIDGYELLVRVKERWPHIVRIVLSGHSEREAIVKTATLAHQFLSKPSSSELIKETIDRSLSMAEMMFNKNARRVLSQIDSLPTLPDLYTKIKEAIESPTGSLADVGKLVSQDIGMSANILKQVNSSFWGLPQKISTPEMAVNMLGSDVIRSLILSAHILRALPIRTGSGSKYSVDELMKESALASRIGRELATLEGLSRENKDAASISGLFHDLGELILNSYFPESHDVALMVAATGQMPLYKAESDVLDVNHQELGAYLLGIWGMSMTVVEAVAKHHEPTDMSDTEESLVVLISSAAATTIDLHTFPPCFPDSFSEILERSKPGRAALWLEKITTIMKEVSHGTSK